MFKTFRDRPILNPLVKIIVAIEEQNKSYAEAVKIPPKEIGKPKENARNHKYTKHEPNHVNLNLAGY